MPLHLISLMRQQGSKASKGREELENVNSGRFRELPEALELQWYMCNATKHCKAAGSLRTSSFCVRTRSP